MLELEGGQVNDDGVACALWELAYANRILGLYNQGIEHSEEAVGIHERLCNEQGRGKCVGIALVGYCLMTNNLTTWRARV